MLKRRRLSPRGPALDLHRRQDGAARASLDEHRALQTVDAGGGGRQGNRLRRTAPTADANEFAHDIAMGNGATAILSGTDRHLDRSRIVVDQPDVSAASGSNA